MPPAGCPWPKALPKAGQVREKTDHLTGKHERPAGHVIGDVMNKFERVVLIGIIEALFCFCASAVFGQQNNNGQPTQNANNNGSGQAANVQGRWSFVITSGDGPQQLAGWGQSSIDTYILQSGSTLTNVAPETYMYMEVDQYGMDLPATGKVTGDNVTITFSKAAGADGYPGQQAYSFTFTGVYNDNKGASPQTITGTYTDTVNNANLSAGSGNFVATFFSDWTTTTTYAGILDSLDNGGSITPQTYPASITLKTDPTNHWLTGSVNVASLVNPQTGVACFANEPLTIFNPAPGQLQGESFATGQTFDIFAQDSLGNYIYMSGYAVSQNGGPAEQYEWWAYPPPSTGNGPYGTNNSYAILFNIYGGPCDQWKGADKPFTIVGEGHHNGNDGNHPHGHRRNGGSK